MHMDADRYLSFLSLFLTRGPPLARTIVGGSGGGSGGDEEGDTDDTDTGLQTYGLVQLALIITMQVCYEACLTWVDQVELGT